MNDSVLDKKWLYILSWKQRQQFLRRTCNFFTPSRCDFKDSINRNVEINRLKWKAPIKKVQLLPHLLRPQESPARPVVSKVMGAICALICKCNQFRNMILNGSRGWERSPGFVKHG